ncbi:MAG: hypothetical protein QNJ15_02325 [Erythrobacter sp.]|nr:hypothetical protein [Erythrobacter sp.]
MDRAENSILFRIAALILALTAILGLLVVSWLFFVAFSLSWGTLWALLAMVGAGLNLGISVSVARNQLPSNWLLIVLGFSALICLPLVIVVAT